MIFAKSPKRPMLKLETVFSLLICDSNLPLLDFYEVKDDSKVKVLNKPELMKW